MIAISPMKVEVPHLRYPHSDSDTIRVSPSTNMAIATATATPSVTHNTSVTKRPKLSLQTSSLPISVGKSTTELSRTCSTASPTVLNTFNNAYDVAQPLSSTAETSSPSKPPYRFPRHLSTHICNFRTEVSAPYQLPRGLRSILHNSPIPKPLPRPSVSMSANGALEHRHVYFPAKKQVRYCFPLEEEIKTVRFVARHSDLESDSEVEPEQDSESDSSSGSSTVESSDQSSDGDDENTAQGVAGETPYTPTRRKRQKSIPSKRQIRAVAIRHGLYDDWASSPISRQNRRKRRCKWRWTLGDSHAAPAVPESISTITTDYDPSGKTDSEKTISS